MTDPLRYTLPAEVDRLPALTDAIDEGLAERGVPAATAALVMIALDEILSNIVLHGGGSTIEIEINTGVRTIDIRVADDGRPFDPLAHPAPDTTLGLDDRKIGGLGIHLVREMMDCVEYHREDERNLLTFNKTF